MPELPSWLQGLVDVGLVGVGAQLLLLLIATLIALRFAQVTVEAALRRLFDREVQEGTAQDVSAVELQRRRETLNGLISRSLRIIILIIAFLMALHVLSL